MAAIHQTNFYRKVERKQFAQSVKFLTPENEYWNTFKSSHNDESHLTVPFLRFCQNVPYDCISCSAMEVRLFDGLNFECKKRLSFRTNPICADVRYDNKMVAVGGARGMLRIYNNTLSTQLSVMRSLNGHSNEIRDVLWDLENATRLLSCSNDKTIRYWDISESSQIGSSMDSHSDFVRCMNWNTYHENGFEFISGSYDHTCKLWDLRNCKDNTTFTHSSPIEDCVCIPNSDLIAIAGTPDVTIWSLRKNSDKPLFTLKMHRKTVNSLAVNRDGTRLFTACLDNHVRIFDCHSNNFSNTHVYSLPSAVLNIDISNDGMCIAMATLKNGILFKTRPNSESRKEIEEYLKERNEKNESMDQYDNEMKKFYQSGIRAQSSFFEIEKGDKTKSIRYASKDWFIRGQKNKYPLPNMKNEKEMNNNNYDDNDIESKMKTAALYDQGSLLIDELNRQTMSVTFKQRSKLKQYDMALKQFRYSDALDAALSTKDTLTVHSVLQDLWRRDGLAIALGGRDYTRLIPILEYIIYSLPHPHLSETSIHCCAIIIDLYKNVIGGVNDQVDTLFIQMYQCVDNMIKKHKILLKLQGSIESILGAQDVIANPLPKFMLDFNDNVENVVKQILKNEEKKNKDKDNANNDIEIKNRDKGNASVSWHSIVENDDDNQDSSS